MNIFFNSGQNLSETKALIEKTLFISFKAVVDGDALRYEYAGLGFIVVLFDKHGLEDDRGIAFSSYEYEMDFDPIRGGVEGEYWEKLQYDAALYSFERITKALKYPAILVDDLQKMVSSFKTQ